MSEHVITREALLSGHVQRMAREGNPGFTPLSEEEMAASRAATLAACPDRGDGSVWVFGYGSLIWNPAFHFVETRVGVAHGWHRRFCLWTLMGRGSPEQPGLMLGLDRGGRVGGLALRIAPEAVEQETALIWRREMVGNAYVPRWLKLQTAQGPVHAIAFTINRAHPRYLPHIDDAEAARVIAVACGRLGPCADYLFNTHRHLAELGLPDRRLRRLTELVRRELAARGV